MSEISFRRLKPIIRASGMSVIELAEKCETSANRISMICNGVSVPKTDFLAKLCSVFKVYPSEIVSFDDIKINDKYFRDDMKLPLPDSNEGLVTYKPLWMFLVDYLDEYNYEHKSHKTENDLFNQIEPPRRLKGYKTADETAWKKAVAARYGEGYKSDRTKRTDYSKGLPAATRTKLRNDRPLNLSVIYEICKKLGCSIDFVMSYK